MARVITIKPDKLDRGARTTKDREVDSLESIHRRREVAGIVLLSLAFFLLLSVASLALGDGKLMGPVGLWVATAIYSMVGVGAMLCMYGLLLLAVRCLRSDPLRVRAMGVLGMAGAVLSAAVLLHLILGNYRLHDMPPGGALGEYGAEMTKALVGTAGTALLGMAGFLVSLLISTSISFRAAFEVVGLLGQRTAGLLTDGVRAIFPTDEEVEEAEGDEDPKEERPQARRAREGAPVEGVPIVTADKPLLAPKVPTLVRARTEADGAEETQKLVEGEVAKDAKETPKEGQKEGPKEGKKSKGEAKPEPVIATRQEPVIATKPEPAIAVKPEPAIATKPEPAIFAPVAAGAAVKAAMVAEAAQGPAARRRGKKDSPAGARTVIEARGGAGEGAEGEEDVLRGAPTLLDIRDAVPENIAGKRPIASMIGDPAPELAETEDEIVNREAPQAIIDEQEEEDLEDEEEDQDQEEQEEEDEDPGQEVQLPVVVPATPTRPAKAVAAAARAAAPVIQASRGGKPAGPAAQKAEYIKIGTGEFKLPSIELLDYLEQGQGDMDRQAMLDLAQRLEKTLADYLVKGRVSEIHPGPVVTMYEFVPAPGTKLSKITALSNDLAMALEALKVRIVAPIPGKAAVGIEVPNRGRETVFLKEILADDTFIKAKSKLTMALGKDIAGVPVCVDLAKMPHLLVAGTTGSGKSVAVNGMVCSILLKASPDEVKMIMIDPKMLELSIYEGIPHLLLPVVTDPKKANLALQWAVDEMERRYELISKSGVRDIAGYNKKLEKFLEEGPKQLSLEPRFITVKATGRDGVMRHVQVFPSEEAVLEVGGVVTGEILGEISDAIAESEAAKEKAREDPPRKLPYIVVLIDEFADLMMVASKEVEISVARIAQKARAAGIHLIVATQRPSVDVITGLIKANFPSRVAFQVASRVDSRTILDAQGAENLLGMGDMLFTDRGQALRRIHGALITDTEIHRLVEHLKKQGQPIYDMEILKPRSEDEGEAPEEDMSDEMYDQAVRLVAESRQASISMIQRRLRIGYNRSARMVERMEREGIVSAADGAKGREVLIQHMG